MTTVKEYISKAVETDSGFEAACWVVTGIWLDLKANAGSITLEGYKDFASKEAGKTVMGTKSISIPDLTVMDSYIAVRSDLLALVFASPVFTGATLEQVETEVVEPNLEV